MIGNTENKLLQGNLIIMILDTLQIIQDVMYVVCGETKTNGNGDWPR